jgi:hypothetical protein
MPTDFAGRSVNSQSKDWCTPPKYVDAISEFFNGKIELDPCSNAGSIVPAKTRYILPDNDGLKDSWDFKTIFVNPPYGADTERKTTIKDWIERCNNANQNGSEVLALIPVATNTKHWKEHIFGKACAICFLGDTRLKFLVDGNTDNKGAPMACCMVYWGNNLEKFKSVFKKFGEIMVEM